MPGYISFAVKIMDVQFGYDKNFIGNGYRSLFLSDLGKEVIYFKARNTKSGSSITRTFGWS